MREIHGGTRYNGDSYKPRPRSRSPRSDDMYRFSGTNIRGGEAKPRGDHYNGSDYSRTDFSFRNNSHQTQWPAGPRVDYNRPSRNPNRNRKGPGGRGGRWHTRGSKAANERKILNTGMDRDMTPERLEGMTQGVPMFNPDQEDSDPEIDEDIEEQDDSEDGRSKKRVKTAQAEADSNEKPKWSNPDPYFSLPPVLEDANTKKKDVVELIRKAKIAAEKEKEDSTNAVVQNDDFISFAMDEDEDEEDHISISSDNSSDIVKIQAPATSNSVPFSHLTSFHPLLANIPAATGVRPTLSVEIRRGIDAWPPRTNQEAVNRPQQRDTSNKQRNTKRKRDETAGDLARDWVENRYERAVPWLKEDHSDLKSTAVWLHKEICDFYEFVKPTDYEHVIRRNCVERIASALRRDYPDFDLRSFGSYAYGIYLPTADMDLVLISRRYQQTGRPDFNPRHNQLQRVLNSLRKAGITAEHGSQVVSKAKVPIIKFVDRLTGLKVDISFENLTGIIALSSFDAWKAQYPQFTVLVTLIKQFLLMRDLNEVFNGGLGGFSVACLVVSMLQHSPDIQSGNPPTLGALLLRFLKLYGSEFNMTSLGISVNPPKYIPKDVYNKSYGKAKWLIHDPHNPDNDVSGGSSKAEYIADKFYDAYHILRDLMDRLDHAGPTIRKGRSILHPIFGGNYQSFLDQREQLQEVYDQMRVQGYFS